MKYRQYRYTVKKLLHWSIINTKKFSTSTETSYIEIKTYSFLKYTIPYKGNVQQVYNNFDHIYCGLILYVTNCCIDLPDLLILAFFVQLLVSLCFKLHRTRLLQMCTQYRDNNKLMNSRLRIASTQERIQKKDFLLPKYFSLSNHWGKV